LIPEIRVRQDLGQIGSAFGALKGARIVALNPFLHPECGVACADGMILVGQWRPEKRHDPVTHHLVNGAFVPMDRLHHVLDDRVEELPRLLRVTVGEELHRALEVGKEDRDLFALALKGRLRGEDFSARCLGV
jgi:hypothetical protein